MNFTKDNLLNDGKFVYFIEEGKAKRFVARFRIGSPKTFMTHLRKNWTVEDYFTALEEPGTAPLEIVKKTGYMLPHIKKWLREGGYPVTPAGFEQMVKDQSGR